MAGGNRTNRRPALKIPELGLELSRFRERLDIDFQSQRFKSVNVSRALSLEILPIKIIATEFVI
jgi:hypothetical protein